MYTLEIIEIKYLIQGLQVFSVCISWGKVLFKFVYIASKRLVDDLVANYIIVIFKLGSNKFPKLGKRVPNSILVVIEGLKGGAQSISAMVIEPVVLLAICVRRKSISIFGIFIIDWPRELRLGIFESSPVRSAFTAILFAALVSTAPP